MGDGCGNARHMEVGTVLQYLVPGNHAWFQVVVRRVGTVVDHFGCTHTGSRLKIVGTDALSTIEYMAGINAQLG